MNKNQNWRRVLSLLFAMAMLVSIMVVGSVVASAEEVEAVQEEHYVVSLKINGVTTYYTSFDAAWDAMNETGNVQVNFCILEDITVDKQYVLEKEKHINFLMSDPSSKYTLTGTTDEPLFVINKGRMAVKNITIVSKGDTFQMGGGTLSIQAVGGTSNQRTNVTSLEGTVLNLTGGTADFTGGPIVTALGNEPAVKNDGNGTLSIKEWNTGYGNDSVVSAPNAESVIVWNGAGALNISYGFIDGEIEAAEGANVNVTGGKFSVDMTDYCDPAYCTVKDADGNYVLAPKVLTVNGVAFPSWEDAAATITANTGWAPKQVDIVLYSDVNSAKYGFNPNGTVNIDLNGHNWTVHQCGISYNTVITVTNSSDVEGQVLTAGADNRLYLGANSVVNLVGNVSFDGTLQMNNGGNNTTGYFRINGENIIGDKDSLFNCSDSTMRITMKDECMNITLIYGVLTLTGEYNTLPGQSIKINTGITVAAGATLTIDPATAITLHQNAVINGEGTVSVGSLEHLLLVLNKTEIKNVDIHTAFACDGAVLEYADVTITGAANLLGSGAVVKAGTFDADVKSLCPAGYCVKAVDNTYVVGAHNLVAGETVAPTFGAEGYTPYSCANCGASENRDVKPALVAVAEVNGVLYASLQEAINACKNGETVKVLADLVFGADDVVAAVGGATGFGQYYNPTVLYVGGTAGSPNMPSEVNVVIDLNGHTLTNNANAYFFMIMDNAKVTFTDSVGNGKMNTNADGPVLWVIGTETLVTIEGGYYETASAGGVMHSTHGGDLVINGGEFKTTADNASLLLMLNSKDRNNSKFFIKGVATITVKGGTFHGFNPQYIGDDNGATSLEDIKFVNGCAEGYVPVENEDGSFGVQKKIFKSYNLLLGNTIGIYFNLDMDAINVQTWNKLTLVVYDAAGNTVEIPYSEWKNGKVLFNGLAAKQMSDEFYAQVFYNGEALSEKSPLVSVKAYAEIVLNSDKYDESAKNLVKALLNYGAQAQNSFGHNTDDLANDILADADKVVAAPEVSADTVKDTGYYGASLNAETNVQFNFKFYASAVEGATKVVVTYGDTTLELDLAEVELATETKKGQTLVVVTLDTLVIADANELLNCKFVDAEGNVYAEATDSIASYCARAIAGLSALEATAYEKQNFKLEFYYSIMNYANAVVAYNNK